MAELELHTESHRPDPAGQKVGVLAAVLAVGLAVVSIASHRTHTAAVVLKAEANDRWAYHQAKRVKFHNLELGEDLLSVLSTHQQEAERVIAKYRLEKERYDRESKEVADEARHKEGEEVRAEHRALRYDFGEGLLEIGLVLTSLYFISLKRLFPALGIAAGILGAVISATGLLV